MTDRLSVFLDTNILVEYFRGKYSTLFSEQTLKRVKFAVNPIVLQELLLIADADKHSDRLEQVKQLVEVLPIDFQHVEAFLPKVKELRNRLMHSNDILIVTSAAMDRTETARVFISGSCETLLLEQLANKGDHFNSRRVAMRGSALPRILVYPEIQALAREL